MAVPKVKEGTVIAGRYRLGTPLSRGGMGSVWRAEHLALGSPIAIKLIDASLVEHDEPRARFEQEARAAAALRSPHVVQILDHGVDRGLPFIAMELLDGESLGARLHRMGKLPPAQIARVFQDVARAMKKAHELGIVHRDLKPDNIFLVRNDDQEIAKVLDFGIAKAREPFGEWKGGTRTGALIGTPQYMSPEQAQGMPVDARTDLWALGVIAFECVCGTPPFPSEKPGELILQICAKPLPVPSHLTRVPPRFDAWFARACDREPHRRFASAKELADTLAEVLGVGPSADASGGFAASPYAAALSPSPVQPSPAVRGAPVPRVDVLPAPPIEMAPTPLAQGPILPPQHVDATMSGGAVVDSDPSTLLFVPGGRSRKVLVAVAALVVAAASFGVVWFAAHRSTGAAAGADTPPPSAADPGPGKATSVTPMEPVQPTPAASGAPLSSGSASASAAARPAAPAPTRPVVTAPPLPSTGRSTVVPHGAAHPPATATNSRIGF